MTQHLLSIIIPSYNCADLLSRSVRSAYKWDKGDIEVIIVDDGSNDDTSSVLAELRHEFPLLRIFSKPNGGLSSARNHGIAQAVGEYILLLDADDELIPADIRSFLADRPDMIRVGLEEIRMDANVKLFIDQSPPVVGIDYLQTRLAQGNLYPPSVAYLYRRDWLRSEGLHFQPGLLHEDMLFTVQALLAARVVISVPTVVYRYFRRQGSITMEQDSIRRTARVRALGSIASSLTDISNSRSDIDLSYWIRNVIAYAHSIAVRSPNRHTKWIVLRMQMAYLLHCHRHTGLRHLQPELRRLRFFFKSVLANHVESGSSD